MKLHYCLMLAGALRSLATASPSKQDDYPTRPLVESEKLQALITTEGLMGNLQQLQKIASENGGNRAFGLPGYAKSVEYILSRTQNVPTFTTWTQDFPALFTQVKSINFTVDTTSYYIIGLTYSPSTPEEGLTAPLVLGPSGETGCSVDGYANLDVTDKIVLIDRFRCPDGTTFAGRIRPATAAGAAGVIVYSDVDTKVTGGTLSQPDPVNYVSSGYINRADGLPLVSRLQAGEDIEAYFQQTQIFETRITQNVFTETNEGDPNNVIMLGGHLDSVQAGPGINDDGSGSSLIMEVKVALEKFTTKNKVRFAWWGAEENGLLGSDFYTKSLNASEANKILAYLNFDMVSRGYFGVFDGDGSSYNLSGPPGSDVIEKLFVDDMTKKGINVTAARFTGGSDYASFTTNLGKPVGGLHTGTGVEQDPCYHQACDTIDNPDPTTITVNAKAAAHVLSILATQGEKIIPRNTMTASNLMRRESGAVFDMDWTVFSGDHHLATCGQEI